MAPQNTKIAVEILQSVNNRTQSLRKILRMVITDSHRNAKQNFFLGDESHPPTKVPDVRESSKKLLPVVDFGRS